jgi:putative flippase GtrA
MSVQASTFKYKAMIIQFVKYVFVGGVAFVFDFATLYLLTEYAGLHYLLSAALAFIIGLNVNYFLAKYIVFKASKIENRHKEYFFIILISLSGLALNQILIWSFTELIGVYYLFSKVVAAGIILVYNFAIRKIFIFE